VSGHPQINDLDPSPCPMIYTFTPNPSLDRTFVLDRMELGEYNRGELTRFDLGGKGINVSRNLKSLGLESVILGFFGGRTGTWLVEDAKDQGYRVVAFEVKGESRSNLTVIESDGDRLTKLNEFGPEILEGEASALLQWAKDQTQPEDIWVFSGSLPPGVSDDYYGILIDVIQTNGGRAYFDSSGKPLASGWKQKPYLVHGNQQELGSLLSYELSTRDACLRAIRELANAGVEHIVMSRGDQGAFLASDGQFVEAVPEAVKVQNPVGAGDAMMAAMIFGHLKSWDPERVLRWAVSAGTVSAMKEGAATADCSEIRAFESRVTCYTLSF
jgi:1-phosphofructokinase